VYNALTNRDTFGKLLQQGLEEEYQQYKNQLIEFFMNMKDKVRIEDLIIYEPIWTLKREKGKCSTCNEFANIHCVNCYDNIWLCVDHWTHHKVDYHRL
jgi:alpha-amylase/alpha-mannosidase (GH57 family)